MAQLKSTKVFGDLNVTGEVNASTKITVNGKEVWDTGNLLNIGTTAATARTALGLGAGATRWPTFAEVTGKPATYAPSGHTHPISQVTGLDAALADKADKTTQVIAGTGLTGGGTLAANRTLNVSYGSAAGTAAQGNDSRIVNAVPNSRTITAGTGLTGGGTLAANRTLAVSYGTAAGTAAQGNDSRLSNSREWTASAVSQAEAEAGTATTARKWTAQRVAQAISALGLKIGTTASTAKAGNWMPTWANVTGKPTTFAPSAHTHSLSQITDAGSVASLNTNASTANFLRGDGTWVTPPNTNTTYSEITTAEIDAGTASTSRTITGRRMKYALDKKSDTGHTHTWAQVTGQPATATRWPTFAEVTGKPTNYATTWNSVAAKPAQATRWPTLAEVTGKPTNYPTNWATVSNKPIVQTVGTSTTNIMSQKAVTEALGDVGQPTMTSNAVLNRIDNSIVATGITSNLGLEIGDVIEVDNDSLRSGFLKPLGQTDGQFYQFATKGNDVYVANYSLSTIMKQTNGEGLFEKIEGIPAYNWSGICFIGEQMYAAARGERIYSVDEATGATDIMSTRQGWYELTTDGTHIYASLSSTSIVKIDPITKTEEWDTLPKSPYGDVRGLVYSPIDNSLYMGAGGDTHPIRKLVNMTGTWIDVSTEKRPWSSASYYNGKVYFSDHNGQVWRENDAGDDFELFSTQPTNSPSAEGGNIIFNDILYKSQLNGDIYTTPIIKKDIFTVESIVSADKIIVNYAHAFGAGSKSLWSQTLSATKFKRIAKWVNAPLGLGQAWVVVEGSRVREVDYVNTTGRSIQIGISATRGTVAAGEASFDVFVDGVNIVTDSSARHSWTSNVFAVVSNESSYRAEWNNGVSFRNWVELR